MKTSALLITGLSMFASLALVACGGDDSKTNPVDSGTPDTTGQPDTGGGPDTGKADTGVDAGPPAPPTLGTQVDRFGRPAVNTALNHVFDPDTGDGGTGGTAGAAKDTYNADKNPAGWVAAYKPEFAKNLAIFDGLDTNCGNQLAAGGTAVAGRYDTLATVLAVDVLWTNTAGTACTQYLGVELNALMVPNLASDCGGRTLKYDVIDITYSGTAIGKLSGVTDGIGPVAAKTNGTTFPYLAPPQ